PSIAVTHREGAAGNQNHRAASVIDRRPGGVILGATDHHRNNSRQREQHTSEHLLAFYTLSPICSAGRTQIERTARLLRPLFPISVDLCSSVACFPGPLMSRSFVVR